MKEGGVYQVINKSNGKRYVGSTVNLHKRRRQHWACLRRGKHRNIHLQRAWNLYGGKAFAFAVLEYVPDLERLVEREQHYFDALQPEYNIAPVAGSTLGCKHTEEARRNMSEARKGKVHTAETRRKLSEARRGVSLGPKSEEQKRKLSAANKGQGKGRVLSAETKAKISEASKGRVFSEETKRKISEAHRGTGCHTAKLSDQDVMEIKALLEESVLLQREIAARYGVTPCTIGSIKHGRTWSHIGGDEGEVKAA